jgi:thioredoxin-dependent peroxiredoxin
MKRRIAHASLVLAGLAFACGSAQAALSPGDKAPDFALEASLGSEVFRFSLADALKRGPVVLYFFPAAFTKACTYEAHEFAEATDTFRQLGATVIGVSHDGIDKLKEFAVSECRGKFAVGADTDQRVMKAYDAVLKQRPDLADRTSYLIAPDGTVAYEYTSLNPEKHVANLMDALKAWRARRP